MKNKSVLIEEVGAGYFACEENMRIWNYIRSSIWLSHFSLTSEVKHWNEISIRVHMCKGQFIYFCSLCWAYKDFG
jgi:hypothetical protein